MLILRLFCHRQGFTFLRIPRSYYGILTKQQLEQVVSDGCAQNLLLACDKTGITGTDGSVDLALTYSQVQERLDAEGLKDEHATEYKDNKEAVIGIILKSRYVNLHNLLQHHLSEESYLGIVRNQILVDVQVSLHGDCSRLPRFAKRSDTRVLYRVKICSTRYSRATCCSDTPERKHHFSSLSSVSVRNARMRVVVPRLSRVVVALGFATF